MTSRQADYTLISYGDNDPVLSGCSIQLQDILVWIVLDECLCIISTLICCLYSLPLVRIYVVDFNLSCSRQFLTTSL